MFLLTFKIPRIQKECHDRVTVLQNRSPSFDQIVGGRILEADF